MEPRKISGKRGNFSGPRKSEHREGFSRKMRFIVLSLLSLFLMQLVSAEIILSQPSAIYNYGDILKIQATIVPNEDKADFFELNLNCGIEKNFYRQFLNLKKSEKKSIDAEILLLPSFIDTGLCSVKSGFSNEEKESQNFKISDLIRISLNAPSVETEAGKNILVNGNAIKENGLAAEGFVELTAENLSIKAESTVNGNFSLNFSFPENAKSQQYNAGIKVYEKKGEETTNKGEIGFLIEIKQTPKRLEIIANEQNEPGSDLLFKVNLLDQAGDEMQGRLEVKIYDNSKNVIFQKVLESGQEGGIYLAENSGYGEWKLEAEYLNLKNEKSFYVSQLEKASFDVLGNSLTVTNVGNIVYKKAVQISIGEYSEIKNIELDVGGSMKFKLNAPDGNYEVKISDGKTALDKDNVALTGDAVKISEFKNFDFITRYPIVWLFLIMVFGMFILLMYRRVVKRKFFAYPPDKIDSKIKKPEIITTKDTEEAEHTLVLDGNKEEASLLAVKIKNLNETKKLCSDTLSSIFRTIINNKGAVYETSDFIIGIFSSATTRTFRNEMTAIKTGKRIEEILLEHNRKFREKINFGISLNSGELITKKHDKKLKFTAIGNTLNLSRRVAELANEELLISENFNKKIMNETRTERSLKDSLNVYKITRIMDRDKNASFIQGFLDRQKNS